MVRLLRGYTLYEGYTWKMCPYSRGGWYKDPTDPSVGLVELYKELFYDNGYRGPSTNPVLMQDPWTIPTTTEHTTTSGRMMYKYDGGPGWVCKDPNCYYYTTYGYPYFES